MIPNDTSEYSLLSSKIYKQRLILIIEELNSYLNNKFENLDKERRIIDLEPFVSIADPITVKFNNRTYSLSGGYYTNIIEKWKNEESRVVRRDIREIINNSRRITNEYNEEIIKSSQDLMSLLEEIQNLD